MPRTAKKTGKQKILRRKPRRKSFPALKLTHEERRELNSHRGLKPRKPKKPTPLNMTNYHDKMSTWHGRAGDFYNGYL